MAAFVATDPTTTHEVRVRKETEARRDFGLARSFGGKPLGRPFLIAVGGVIGSGKSTLATAIGRALGVPVVSSDRTRKGLAGLQPTARGDTSLYDPEQKERTYAEILRRATVVLDSGRGVIVDATFAASGWRRAAADVARIGSAIFVFVEAHCVDTETLRARLVARRRGGSVSDATDELLDRFLSQYQSLGSSDPEPRFSVDTSGTPAAALRDALARLATFGVAQPVLTQAP